MKIQMKKILREKHLMMHQMEKRREKMHMQKGVPMLRKEEDDAGENLFEDEDSNKTVFDEEDPVRSVWRRCEGVCGGAGNREEGPCPQAVALSSAVMRRRFNLLNLGEGNTSIYTCLHWGVIISSVT